MKTISNRTEFTETKECYHKVISNTTYIVQLHFCKSSKETFEQKIKRLLQEEAKNA